eukprot:3735036-Rhodomonas_salina.1
MSGTDIADVIRRRLLVARLAAACSASHVVPTVYPKLSQRMVLVMQLLSTHEWSGGTQGEGWIEVLENISNLNPTIWLNYIFFTNPNRWSPSSRANRLCDARN